METKRWTNAQGGEVSPQTGLVVVLTVGAEQALKLGYQADQVKLPQEAFVLQSCVQPHHKPTGQGCELEQHTQRFRATLQRFIEGKQTIKPPPDGAFERVLNKV